MAVLLDICAYAFLAIATVWLAFKDIKERRVPNPAIAVLLGAWTCWKIAAAAMDFEFATEIAAQSSFDLLAASAVFVLLFAFGCLYERARKKPSMGMGDIKLIAVLALFIGIRGVGICLLIACLVGLVYAIADVVRRNPVSNGIPFAACLSCGLFVTFLLF